LQRTATIVLWFNPFVHVLANDLTRTLEELCDNAALEHGSPSSFARLLVRLAEGQGRLQLEGLALGVLDDRISLERRVRGLLDPSRRTTKDMKPHTRFALIGTSILATLTMAGTQIVAAQSAWDDLKPSAQSRQDAAIVVQDEPRAAKATRVQLRKAERQARRAQRNGAKAARVRVSGAAQVAPVIESPVVAAPMVAGGTARVGRNVPVVEPKLSRTAVTPSTIVVPQADHPHLALPARNVPVETVVSPRIAGATGQPVIVTTARPSIRLERRPETVTMPSLSRSVSTPGSVVIQRGQNAPKVGKGEATTVYSGQLAGTTTTLKSGRTGQLAGRAATARPGLSRDGRTEGLPTAAPEGEYVRTGNALPGQATAPVAPGVQYVHTGRAAPAQATVPAAPGARAAKRVHDAAIALPARARNAGVPVPPRTEIAEATEVYRSPDHKPVTVIKGATVVIYDDGTTVITKSGHTTTVHAAAKPAKVRATTRKAKSVPKPPKPVTRKVSK
jgi:hypothetical protein